MADKKEVLFDSKLKCRSGKTVPYYDTHWYEDPNNEFTDQSIHWFHEGYGMFGKYKLHQIDDTNIFIAEYLHELKDTTKILYLKEESQV